MAKRIIWSIRAQNDRKKILQYWIIRNKSKEYSKKLFDLFQKAVEIIGHHPQIGTSTKFHSVRCKIVRDYQIFYKESGGAIHILAIWDSRQDPDKLRESFD